jgi:anti-sigma factor RsiW
MIMSCPNYRDALQELADGTLGPIRRAELQVHLESCARCRALASDLVRIKDLAGSLDRLSPPDVVWLQVAGRLRQEGRLAAEAEAPRTSKRRVAALAIAAALVIAVGASIVTLAPRGGDANAPQTAQQGNAAAQDPVQSFANEIRLAEQHLQNAIAKLEQAAMSDEDVMDPQTAEILKKNLQVMDQAIAESRDALRVEPQSASARDLFFGAMKRKVGVLQDTLALMNEIRKGNPAGTGQLVEGLNKS